MKALAWQNGGGVIKSVGWNLGLLAPGSLLCAMAINGILILHRFVSGGVTGVALIFHYLSLPRSWAIASAISCIGNPFY
jgi:hypothetical protein